MLRRILVGSALVLALTTARASAADVTYTAEQVAKHAVPSDCWTIIRGEVYDLTGWVAQHPHGEADIVAMCGNDATGDYEGEHIASDAARSALAPFRIGSLPNSAPAPSPTATAGTATAAPMAQKPRKRTVTCVKGMKTRHVTAARCPAGWRKR